MQTHSAGVYWAQFRRMNSDGVMVESSEHNSGGSGQTYTVMLCTDNWSWFRQMYTHTVVVVVVVVESSAHNSHSSGGKD